MGGFSPIWMKFLLLVSSLDCIQVFVMENVELAIANLSKYA